MTIEAPYFTRLEYWDGKLGDWVVGHAGINLISPKRYVERLADKGKVGRATVLNTGEVFQVLETPNSNFCAHCGEAHSRPHDGRCLL